MRALRENYYKTMFHYTHINKNETIYSQKTYFPVLEVETIVQEKSRDQLGDIEQTLLGFINDGLNDPEDITKMVGFASKTKVIPLIEELRGQGLIQRSSEGMYTITPLGKISLDIGVAMLEVPRAFLLCGISSQLLKKEIYMSERIGIEEFGYISRQSIILDNTPNISLKNLDITQLVNKQEFNIPDEAVEIISCEYTTPKFIQSSLVINKNNRQNVINLTMNNIEVNWLKKEEITPFIEPLGWDIKMSEKEVLKEVEKKLLDLGFIDAKISLEPFGGIKVNFNEVKEDTLKNIFEMEPLLAYIGTKSILPIALNRFPFIFKTDERKMDLIGGHALSLITQNIKLSRDAEIYRFRYEQEELFYQYKRERKLDRNVSLKAFIKEQSNLVDFTLEDIENNIQEYCNEFVKNKYDL